jgi:hypothetical protein
MKQTCLLMVALAATMLLVLAGPALAQEPAKYNFASAQGEKELKIPPGGEGKGVIYFYNIDGNRITHVTLEVSQAPTGWEVSIEPPLAETQVEINGQVVNVTENLYVEPTEVLSQAVESPPPGTVCISVPSRGYALAKEADIIVRVPDTAKIGDTGAITISATARWLGQSGAAAVSQERDFDFSVQVVSGTTGFEEKVLGKPESGGETNGTSVEPTESSVEPTESSLAPIESSAKTGESSGEPTESSLVPPESSTETAESGGGTGNWVLWIIAGAAVLVIVAIVLVYIRRKHD